MKSIDPFLDRVSTSSYNCMDFLQEVWLYLSGEDIKAKLTGLIGDFTNRKVNVSGVKGFKRLQQPVSPCFVVMQRRGFVPHVGLFLDNRILHLTSKGVEFQPLVVSRRYFDVIRYYQ